MISDACLEKRDPHSVLWQGKQVIDSEAFYYDQASSPASSRSFSRIHTVFSNSVTPSKSLIFPVSFPQ